MNIGICDDQISELRMIEKLIEEYEQDNCYSITIYSYNMVDDLLANIEKMDCLVLDVLLDNTTGIEVAKKLYSMNKDLKIIFCSVNPEYSIEAFEVNAFRYLVKPVNKMKLYEYLDDILKYYNETIIIFKDINHQRRTISILDICYIDMQGRKSTVHLKNKTEITVRRKMKEWLEILGGLRFYLSHKGVLVNLKHVSIINKDTIELKNGDSVYLSRLYRKDFQESFFNLIDDML